MTAVIINITDEIRTTSRNRREEYEPIDRNETCRCSPLVLCIGQIAIILGLISALTGYLTIFFSGFFGVSFIYLLYAIATNCIDWNKVRCWFRRKCCCFRTTDLETSQQALLDSPSIQEAFSIPPAVQQTFQDAPVVPKVVQAASTSHHNDLETDISKGLSPEQHLQERGCIKNLITEPPTVQNAFVEFLNMFYSELNMQQSSPDISTIQKPSGEPSPEPVSVREPSPEPAALLEPSPEPAALLEPSPEPAALLEPSPEPAAVLEPYTLEY